MKILEQIGHQGDVQFFRIDSLPTELKKIDKQFIAASEKTGHVHALSGNYNLYEYEDGFVVDVIEDCVLNHTDNNSLTNNWDRPVKLPEKDHKHSVIKKGLYYIGIQRRFNPLKKFWEKVKD